jgi:hypothetical protein
LGATGVVIGEDILDRQLECSGYPVREIKRWIVPLRLHRDDCLA